MVNGVAASSYVVVDEFSSFLTPSQQHSFQQVINGPHRVLYNLGLLGEEETYDKVFGFSESMMLQRSLKIFFFQYYLLWSRHSYRYCCDWILDVEEAAATSKAGGRED